MHDCTYRTAITKRQKKTPFIVIKFVEGLPDFTLYLLLCFKLLKSLNGGRGRREAYYSQTNMKTIFKLGQHQDTAYYGT